MVSASQILAAIQPYLTEENKINPGRPMQTSYVAGQIYIYQLRTNPSVIVYTTSAAVDCDGQPASQCATDPTNQSDTSCQQSNGMPLDPVGLPWYVIPETPNPYFNYPDYDISCGQVGLVIYGNNMQYGVFGDERGRDVGNSQGQMIGEVSYAMADSLGINPDPDVGGIESGVTYIIFTGGSNVADLIEDPGVSVSIGTDALNTMLSQLGGSGTTQPPGGTIPPGTGAFTCSPACSPTQTCLFGTCVEKKYITYGIIGFGALFLLSILKK